MKLFSHLLLQLLFVVSNSFVLLSFSSLVSATLRFGIIGDWGMGGRKTPWDTEIRSAAAYNEACEKFFSEGSCNLTISCGDNIYTPDVGMGLRESFGLFSKNTGPFFPVSGNHDSIRPQLDYAARNKRWKWPSPYHDFIVPIDSFGRDGHTAQFFGLDVMDGGLREGGAQYKWVEEKLKASTSRWKIFFAHFPVVGAGRHRREGSVTSVTKLMSKYNVQVFFSGHDHILDVNVAAGKVFPISGAMARGGMMLRSLAGGSHQFTLTQPGEFNGYKVDWPGHGFFTAELSANILTVHSWDHYGGIMFSFQVTHDWVAKVHNMPSSMENKFPPPSEIRAAALAERDLPRGPGGGKFYTLDGDEFDAPNYYYPAGPSNASGSSLLPTRLLTEKPLDTKYTKFPDETPATTATKVDHAQFVTTVPPDEKTSRQERDVFARYIRYTVSSECLNCDRDVFANEKFSIFVLGVDLTSKARMFISQSKLGCEMSKYFPKIVDGTGIMQPNGNQAIFQAAKATTSVYVCLSMNAGKNYYLLKRADDDELVDEFAIGNTRSDAAKTAPTSSSPATTATTNSPSRAKRGSGGGDGADNDDQQQQPALDSSSTGQLLMVAGVSILVGVAIATLTKSNFFDGVLGSKLPTREGDTEEVVATEVRRSNQAVDE